MTRDDQTISGRRADLYDRIYHWKDYASEAERVRGLLRDAGVPEGGRVLEAACGTGNYLAHLRRWYGVSGFDLNRDSIAVARHKVPEVDLFVGDMVDFDVDRPVDAIVCLFSSIGYVYPEERLRATAEAFHRNLLPGGVALIEPWLEPHVAIDGHLSQQTYESNDLKLCRSAVHRSEGRRSIMSFHWLVTTAEGVEHFVDDHELWMYTRQELIQAFTDAGFEARWSDEGIMRGRGLVTAKRGR